MRVAGIARRTARRLFRKGGKDMADNRLGAMEVLRPDDRMGDITSAAPGNENFCAEAFGSIEHNQRKLSSLDPSRKRFGGKNRRR